MAELLEDDMGRIKPQYEKLDGSGYEAWKGKDGHGNVRSDDGQIVALGSTTDTSEANTVIGKLIKLLESLPSTIPAEGIPFLPPDLRVALVMPVFGGSVPTICPVEVVYSQLPEGAATEAKQEALANLVGALDAEVVSDPAAAGAVIALLKGVLERLQTLEGKIDTLKNNEENAVDVKLKGSIVQVGDKEYPVSSGSTLRGKAADKPDAAAAHAVIPYCYYFSIDTGVVEATDGTSWAVI